MASKKFYFIKFNPTEWLAGSISLQPSNIQGAFIQCICICFTKGGYFKKKDVYRRITDDEFVFLLEKGYVTKANKSKQKQMLSFANKNQTFEKSCLDELYTIDFIEEQIMEFNAISEKRSMSGSLGGRGKKANKSKQKQMLSFAKQKKADIDIDIDIDIDNNNKENINKRKKVWNVDHDLKRFVVDNSFLNVQELKEPTPEQCDKLIAEIKKTTIVDLIFAMENKADLKKKYKSFYLTLLNWAKNRIANEKSNHKPTNEQRQQLIAEWITD